MRHPIALHSGLHHLQKDFHYYCVPGRVPHRCDGYGQYIHCDIKILAPVVRMG